DTATLDEKIEKARELAARLGSDLDERRTAAGTHLAREVEQHLASLGMDAARFSVTLEPFAGEDILDRAGAQGLSAVQFLLSANPGHSRKPLAAVASGGEAARIALAIRMALSRVQQVPTLLFDEVESGIGARLGEAVGRCLANMASRMQIVSVTHLPQVAAFAENHLLVTKRTTAGDTETFLERIEGAQREEEIAAMMRGGRASSDTRTEARSLLEEVEGET
ncbi:MAG: DNA repair protein RecN, partial [Planctomycetota bacterium]